MADRSWDEQILGFLKKAGEDLRRTGEELRVEAQRLLKEVQDPDTQARVRENLKDLGAWAKKTAADASSKIDQAVKKAETAVQEVTARKDAAPRAKSDRKSASEAPTQRVDAPKGPSKKTVGRKSGKGGAKAGSARSGAKKPLGRRKS